MGSAGSVESMEQIYYPTAAEAAEAVDKHKVAHAMYRTPVSSRDKSVRFWHSFLFDPDQTRYRGSLPPSSVIAPISQGALAIG